MSAWRDEQTSGQATKNVYMAVAAYVTLLCEIGCRRPETGGILLGPVGAQDVVTEFHFDAGGSRSATTYSPDHVTLNHKMRTEWLPARKDLKGFAHSHPGQLDELSPGDLIYIRRLLQKNMDMEIFVALIVLPEEFRLRAFVVPRAEPSVPREVGLVLF